MTYKDQGEEENTNRLSRPHTAAVAVRETDRRMARSLLFTTSTCPFSLGKGGTGWVWETSLGLITGVLHSGQRSREGSSFTPQLTQ